MKAEERAADRRRPWRPLEAPPSALEFRPSHGAGPHQGG